MCAIVTNKLSNNVFGYAIDSVTGALTTIAGSPHAAGTFPVWQSTTRATFAGSVQYYPVGAQIFGYAFLFEGGVTIEVGFGQTSQAYGINDNAEVVGQGYTLPLAPGRVAQAFLYDGSLIDIDNVTGRESAALEINNAGLITGWLTTGTCTLFSCNPGDTHAFLYAGSGLIDVGTLGGTFSQGAGINNLGEIAGISTVATDTLNHLFLYSGGTMHDLGTPFGGSVGSAIINDRGEIAGNSNAGFLYRGDGFEKFRWVRQA